MPTTNPVPSQDPSDLLFNAGKLDEVVNGTANSFTDRLGVSRRTVAGMNADFDAQLADAESDLNVYRADAAASAAEALGYLQTIRATSYGAYASDPATDPLGNPPTVGDEYFNTTANLLKRWNGTTWQASDINTANLAAPSGSSLVGYDDGTVQGALDAVTGPSGSASVGYTPPGIGTVATTVEEKLHEIISIKSVAPAADGVTDDTEKLQRAVDNLPNFSTLDLCGLTLRVKKGVAHPAYPNGDQPCIVVYGKVGVKIRNGTLVVLEHGQGAIDCHTCTGVEFENFKAVGAGNFPPIDGTTGRAEKGVSTAGYYNDILYNSPVYRNNSLNTSGYSTGGYGGSFPQWGGGTASTWGVWNGGYIQNYGFGIAFISCQFCSVEKCEITQFNGSGVYIKNSSDISIEKNRLHNNYIGGVEFFSTNSGRNFTVRGNYIYDNGHPNASRTHGNIDPGYGVATNNGTTPPKNLVITGNFLKGNKRKGVDAHASDRFVCTDNTIEDSGFGIFIAPALTLNTNTTITVSNNTIRNISYGSTGYAYGVYVRGGNSSAFGKATVTGNIIENVGTPTGENVPARSYHGYSIIAANLDACAITGNVVSNETYYGDIGVCAAFTNSIFINSLTIAGNTVSGLFGYGVLGGTGSTSANSAASGNTITLADVSAFSASQTGLYLHNNHAVGHNRITCATPGAVLSNEPLGKKISFNIDLPSLAVTGIKQHGDALYGLSLSVTSASYGLDVTLDQRLPMPTGSTITIRSSVVSRISNSTYITTISQRDLILGKLSIAFAVQDFVAKAYGLVPADGISGSISVEITF